MHYVHASTASSTPAVSSLTDPIQYCIVGAGPGGIQLAYFMQQHGYSYHVFERGTVSGNFFTHFPRHRGLISINKCATGRSDPEFNLRHDWNSLLTNDSRLLFPNNYSKKYWPAADELVHYLNDFTKMNNIKVQYNTNIINIDRPSSSSSSSSSTSKAQFVLQSADDSIQYCENVILATGLSQINKKGYKGIEHLEGYESVSPDPDNFFNQTVAIFGMGNSAFEIAKSMENTAALIHIFSRRAPRFAYQTHYVGDLRALNHKILDAYMLKSLDALIISGSSTESSVGHTSHEKLEIFRLPPPDSRFLFDFEESSEFLELKQEVAMYLQDQSVSSSSSSSTSSSPPSFSRLNVSSSTYPMLASLPDRGATSWVTPSGKPIILFDRAIRCFGFSFDNTIFENSSIRPRLTPNMKYPATHPNFESVNIPGLYVVGTLMHSHDFRKSSGGFIHGFRYLARNLFHYFNLKHRNIPWPHQTIPATIDSFIQNIVYRINRQSDMYQMFHEIGDVIVLNSPYRNHNNNNNNDNNNDNNNNQASSSSSSSSSSMVSDDDILYYNVGETADYYYGLGTKYIKTGEFKPINNKYYLTVTLEYGHDDKDSSFNVFSTSRAQTNPDKAHEGLFLHPVIRLYDGYTVDKTHPKYQHFIKQKLRKVKAAAASASAATAATAATCNDSNNNPSSCTASNNNNNDNINMDNIDISDYIPEAKLISEFHMVEHLHTDFGTPSSHLPFLYLYLKEVLHGAQPMGVFPRDWTPGAARKYFDKFNQVQAN